ncbi:hypothetical protein [Streptomyces sp. NRRL S-237]|uniref:hypothetical protein n=1 Tax=Streptomyces sp. NRRL S-237 TaxID=1463895 RepID=UPI0004C4B0AB|nr:hypothetical protein [Streptomyces sp. NRRL S-237]
MALLSRRIAEVYTALVHGRPPGPTPVAPVSVLADADRAYTSCGRSTGAAASPGRWSTCGRSRRSGTSAASAAGVVSLASGPVDDLSVSAAAGPDGRLRVDFDPNPALYEEAEPARFARLFTEDLAALCRAPDVPVASLRASPVPH